MTKSPSFSSWIKAFRLRTLPLAISSIIMGSGLAVFFGSYSWTVIFLAALTTILLQILSNLANDYGDFQKGTDNVHRLGPERAVQSGEISARQMKTAVIVFASLSLFAGVWLLYAALKEQFLMAIVFFALGIAAIVAAVKYTVGKNAYGYSGLGDLFVFLFFGLTGVIGTYYLNALSISWDVLLPATSVGLLSTGMLNLNNMRDIDNDIKSGKHTLASKLGLRKAKYYHTFLVVGAILAALLFIGLHYSLPWNLLFLIVVPLLFSDLYTIWKTTNQQKLDPFLKRLALSTLVFSILFVLGLLL
ncbi:MAG: 1,4-dihydroxy-2-naphthoate octaprenyltransferase [Bacteroidetes bacterium]|nr:MAG: 1,4-dihydroxy-2-naphthoate octaprenyltransferase [Bacteroidota bacterium]